MARTDPQLNIRIPADLKDALDEVARLSGRSTTAEIIHRLQSSLADKPETVSYAEAMSRLDGIASFLRYQIKEIRAAQTDLVEQRFGPRQTMTDAEARTWLDKELARVAPGHQAALERQSQEAVARHVEQTTATARAALKTRKKR